MNNKFISVIITCNIKIVHFLALTVLPKQIFHMLRILFEALLEAYKKELQFLIIKNTFALNRHNICDNTVHTSAGLNLS